MRNREAFFFTLVTLLLLAGLETGSVAASSGSGGLQYRPSAAHVASCAHAGKAIALPKRFPRAFPVPRGTIFTSTRMPIGGGIAVVGFVPSAGFAQTVHFFPRELPKAGFKVDNLEVDSPHDSEGAYHGRGYRGGWALRAMPACRTVMTIQISAKVGNGTK